MEIHWERINESRKIMHLEVQPKSKQDEGKILMKGRNTGSIGCIRDTAFVTRLLKDATVIEFSCIVDIFDLSTENKRSLDDFRKFEMFFLS